VSLAVPPYRGAAKPLSRRADDPINRGRDTSPVLRRRLLTEHLDQPFSDCTDPVVPEPDDDLRRLCHTSRSFIVGTLDNS
jgi:hypothetical protein